MIDYPTQLDEIDQWLADNFGILPGACSSTENLRYNTARMIAEVLWPKCKESLHISETCKEKGNSFTDVEWEKALDAEVLNAYSALDEDKIMLATVKDIARHFANWQREQDNVK